MTSHAHEAGPLDVSAMDVAIDRATGSRPIPGNAIQYLAEGPDAFDAMRVAINRAKRCVNFENYIIRDDKIGTEFAQLLADAARRGVTVRVLFDALGCRRTSAGYWKRLRAAGVEVRSFLPLHPLKPGTLIVRNHRKYVSVDGVTAFVGGLCIGDEWTADPARNRRPWRDTAVQISGPAVPALELTFARVWRMAGPPMPEGVPAPVPETRGAATVRVIEGVPGRLRVHRTVQLLAAGAAERMWVTDAYLLPPRAMYASLIAAAHDGVDVRLLLPSRSDIPVFTVLARVGYRELLRAGIRIWEWRGAMLHAKTVIVDGNWFKVGSSNLNASSLQANYELDLLIDHAPVTTEAVTQFRSDLARSVEIVLRRPRWAPRRFPTKFLPLPLGEAAPAPEISDHLASRRERSHRAVMAVRQLASRARRSIAGASLLGLTGLGALLILFPKLMAYLLAVVCFWLAGGTAWYFLRRRQLDE